MSALIRQVALVSLTNQVPASTVMRISAALQKQATRDLAPIWQISATVDAFDRLSHVPVGTWPIILGGRVPPRAGGFHTDENGQPLAIVRAFDDIDTLCQVCSHELCEMLVDPFGDRFVVGDSPMPSQSRVKFLVEVCDPSEAAQFGYTINNLLVSDFYTPQYFDPVQSNGVRYSFTGAIAAPREVLPGGYLSWLDPVSRHFFQARRIETVEPDFVDLGPDDGTNNSPRAFVDRKTDELTMAALKPGRKAATMASTISAEAFDRTEAAQAKAWQEMVERLIGTKADEQGPASDRKSPGLRRAPRAPRNT